MPLSALLAGVGTWIRGWHRPPPSPRRPPRGGRPTTPARSHPGAPPALPSRPHNRPPGIMVFLPKRSTQCAPWKTGVQIEGRSEWKCTLPRDSARPPQEEVPSEGSSFSTFFYFPVPLFLTVSPLHFLNHFLTISFLPCQPLPATSHPLPSTASHPIFGSTFLSYFCTSLNIVFLLYFFGLSWYIYFL